MKNIALYISLSIFALFVVQTVLYKKEKNERKRLELNQNSLLEDVGRYRTSDSLNVLSIQELTLTKKEFENYHSDLKETVEKLNLKVSRLQSAVSTGTLTQTKIKAGMKDSISSTDTLKCLEYKDPYLSLNGCIVNDIFEGSIESRDTIDQFVHRVPKKFLFFKFGTKAIRQEVVSRNPNTKISYSKYIEFVR